MRLEKTFNKNAGSWFGVICKADGEVVATCWGKSEEALDHWYDVWITSHQNQNLKQGLPSEFAEPPAPVKTEEEKAAEEKAAEGNGGI